MPLLVPLIMTMSFCVRFFKNVFVMVSLNVGALVTRISVTAVLISLLAKKRAFSSVKIYAHARKGKNAPQWLVTLEGSCT